MHIYRQVTRACAQKGISVNALEKKLGFARSSIRKMDEHAPNVLKMQAMANELDKPIEYFLREDNT